MKYYHNIPLIYCIIVLVIVFSHNSAVSADNTETGFSGWEQGSAYDRLYNYKERDALKGEVVKFQKVTPLPGMAEGTALILDEGGEKILVHLCPWSFASPENTGIRTGKKAKVSGSWVSINGQDIFMAAKVKQGDDFTFKVRLTKDGKPFWSLSAEELAQENAQK